LARAAPADIEPPKSRRKGGPDPEHRSQVNKQRFATLAAVLIAGLTSSGCAGYRESRGYILNEELASAVQVGTDNKTSVERTLGRPTFTGQFNDNEWYYVSRQTSTFAFRNPRVTDQTVLRVRFDEAGNVTAVDRTGEEKIVGIDPYGRTTPTLGRRKSFFEEFFGNIGTVGGVGAPGAGGGQGPGQ
jgi:outer membrane protein assembly factor BamE (lipoprotein component of BamABCDE complex)